MTCWAGNWKWLMMHVSEHLTECTRRYLLCWSGWWTQGFGILAKWAEHSSYWLENWNLINCWADWLVSESWVPQMPPRVHPKTETHRLGSDCWKLLNSDPWILIQTICYALNAYAAILNWILNYLMSDCLWMDYQTFNKSISEFLEETGWHTAVQGKHTVV